MLIARHVLVASGPFGPRLDAEQVAHALARGVQAAGRPQPDLCPIDAAHGTPEALRTLLDAVGYDARMRSARAVVLACERLQARTLAGSFAFEIATRARQGGVPAYAVSADSVLDAFDARMLDLQLIIQARTSGALATAGRRLAQIA